MTTKNNSGGKIFSPIDERFQRTRLLIGEENFFCAHKINCGNFRHRRSRLVHGGGSG